TSRNLTTAIIQWIGQRRRFSRQKAAAPGIVPKHSSIRVASRATSLRRVLTPAGKLVADNEEETLPVCRHRRPARDMVSHATRRKTKMKNKKEIVDNWLPRYTGTPLNEFGEHVLLTNFGNFSPNAATVMDLLSAIQPSAALFLGKCGGLKRKNQLGDLILPIAAIRGEGTSNDYLPPM